MCAHQGAPCPGASCACDCMNCLFEAGRDPMPFRGTKEERLANRKTHIWNYDDDTRCIRCDVKPWHVSSDWPCGADVPRATDQLYTVIIEIQVTALDGIEAAEMAWDALTDLYREDELTVAVTPSENPESDPQLYIMGERKQPMPTT